MTDEELVKLLWPTRADAEAAFKRILDSAFPVREQPAQPSPIDEAVRRRAWDASREFLEAERLRGMSQPIPTTAMIHAIANAAATMDRELTGRQGRTPSREWLRHMAAAEDQCESVSAGCPEPTSEEIDEAVYEAAEGAWPIELRTAVTAAIRKHEELRRQACHTPESQSSPSSSDSPSAPSAGGAFGRRSSSDTADESPSGLRSGSPDEATDEELWSAFNLATGKPYQLSGDRTTRGIRAVYNLGRERWAVVSMQAILDCTPNGAHGMAVVDYLRSAGVRVQ